MGKIDLSFNRLEALPEGFPGTLISSGLDLNGQLNGKRASDLVEGTPWQVCDVIQACAAADASSLFTGEASADHRVAQSGKPWSRWRCLATGGAGGTAQQHGIPEIEGQEDSGEWRAFWAHEYEGRRASIRSQGPQKAAVHGP